MRSALYLQASGSRAERRIRCVVFLIVSFAFLRPMNHRSLESCGDTEECLIQLPPKMVENWLRYE